jgi:hypothetical protein
VFTIVLIRAIRRAGQMKNLGSIRTDDGIFRSINLLRQLAADENNHHCCRNGSRDQAEIYSTHIH